MPDPKLLIKIQNLYFDQQYDEIFDLIQKQLIIEPNNNPIRAWKALCLYKMGDPKKAQNIIDGILAIDPNQADTIRIRGLIYELQGDLEAALHDYNKAIQLNPNFSLAYNSRGGLFEDKNDHDAAISDFSAATQLDPEFSYAYHNRGSVYYNIGDHISAIRDFDKALALNPNLVMTYCYRGRAHTYNNAYDAALQDFSTAIRLAPNLALAYNERGLIYLAEGKAETAIQDFNTAIHLDSKFSEAYYNRGRAYEIKGEFETASQNFTQAINLDPSYKIINVFRSANVPLNKEDSVPTFQNNVSADPLFSNDAQTAGEAGLYSTNDQLKKILSDRALANRKELKRLQVDDNNLQYCLDQIYRIVKDKIIPNLQYETIIDYWLVLLNWGQEDYLSQNYKGSSFHIHKESSGIGLLALTNKSVWIVNDGNSSRRVLKNSGGLKKIALALTGYLDKSKVEVEDLFFQFPHSVIQSVQQNNSLIILKTELNTWEIIPLEPDSIIFPSLSLAYENGIN